MKNGDLVTVKTCRQIVRANGVVISSNSKFTGVFDSAGMVLHIPAILPGEAYRVYRIPCIITEHWGEELRLSYLDSFDIPAEPKVLINETVLEKFVGQQPVYR